MNDLITAATSGLFVEVGKVIEHMKAQQARIADLERQLAEASAPAVERKPNKTLLTVANDVRWACMKLYSPDDTATDWADKMAALDIRAIVEKVQPAAAPQAADTDKVREALPELPMHIHTHPVLGKLYDRIAMHCYGVKCMDMAAQAPVREVPEGWQLVPVEPTEEMLKAIVGGADSPGSFLAAAIYYQKVLAASPLPAAPVLQEGATPTNKEQAQ